MITAEMRKVAASIQSNLLVPRSAMRIPASIMETVSQNAVSPTFVALFVVTRTNQGTAISVKTLPSIEIVVAPKSAMRGNWSDRAFLGVLVFIFHVLAEIEYLFHEPSQ